MYLIFKHTPEYVFTHNRSTNGWEFISTAESIDDFYNQIEKIENDHICQLESGVVLDSNGNEVYHPDEPTIFEFGDYTYHLVKPDLDAKYDSDVVKIKAIRQAEDHNSFEVYKAMRPLSKGV